jgi:hypothetical protein
MGDCGTKNTTTNNKVTSTINETLTEMVNSVNTNQFIQTINLQNATVEFGDISLDNCDNATLGNITQTSNVTQTVKVSIDTSTSANLASQVTSAINTAIKNSTEQKQGIFTTASVDNNTFNNTEEYVSNLVSTKIGNETVQEIKAVLNNAQNGNFRGGNINCRNSKGLVLGNILQNALVSQIVDIILKSLLGVEQVQEFKSSSTYTAENKTKQENTGLTGLVQALFDGLSKLVGSAVLAAVLAIGGPFLIIVSCVCACIMVGKSGGGGGGNKTQPAAKSAFGANRGGGGGKRGKKV